MIFMSASPLNYALDVLSDSDVLLGKWMEMDLSWITGTHTTHILTQLM